MMKKLAFFLLLAYAPAYAAQETVKSSAPAQSYAYRGRHLRDPFAPLIASSTGGTGSSGEKTAVKTLQELENEFDPSVLIIKALVGQGKKSVEMAVVASAEDPGQSYLIRGNSIKHIPTGKQFKTFAAQIQGTQIFIKKLNGSPSVTVVNFPKKEEERQ